MTDVDQDKAFLSGQGRMGDQIQSHDWQSTSLGATASWPQPLRLAIGLALDSYQPTFILCGPQRILLYNDAYANILGRKHPAALGQPFDEVWPDLVPVAEAALDQAFAGEAAQVSAVRVLVPRRTAPEERFVGFSCTPLRDSPGGVIGVFCPCVDMTEQVLIQQRLRRSERHFRELADAAPAMLWVTDAANQCTYLSRAWYRHTGQQAADETGLAWLTPVHPEDRHEAARAFLHAARARSDFQMEYRLRTAGGEYRWALDTGHPQTCPDGQFRGYVGSVIDIHPRRLALQALRESEGRFRAMADGLPLMVWVHGPDGEQEFVNRTFCSFFGVQPEQMRGEIWRTLTHPEDADAYATEFMNCVRDRRVFHAQTRARRADGQWRWLECWASPRLSESGEFLGFVGTSADITEHVLAEQVLASSRDELDHRVRERTTELQQRADQLARLTGELTLAEQRERQRLAHVLHDHLQQILVGAKYQIEALIPHVATPAQELARNVKALMEDAIDCSRSLTVELAPPVLPEGIEPALNWLAARMEQTHGLHVQVASSIENPRLPQDWCVLLFRAVRELLLNVVKHSGVDRAQIQISAGDPGLLRVSVSDAGQGFDPQAMLRASAPDGGFGLCSIQERLTLLGGRMEIDAAAGSGARFSLIAPLN